MKLAILILVTIVSVSVAKADYYSPIYNSGGRVAHHYIEWELIGGSPTQNSIDFVHGAAIDYGFSLKTAIVVEGLLKDRKRIDRQFKSANNALRRARRSGSDAGIARALRKMQIINAQTKVLLKAANKYD